MDENICEICNPECLHDHYPGKVLSKLQIDSEIEKTYSVWGIAPVFLLFEESLQRCGDEH